MPARKSSLAKAAAWTLATLLVVCAPALAAAATESLPFAAPPPWGVQGSSWHLDLKAYAAGAHGTLACQSCHAKETQALAPGSDLRHPDPKDKSYLKNPVRQAFDYAVCAQCHHLAFERMQTGAHAKAAREQTGKALASGQAPAPNCGYCHDPHYQASHQDRLTVGRRATEVCGSCHPRQLATYLEGYHGQAAFALGHAKAAFCSDCHGGHAALSLKEPQAALAACQRCHPQAGPSFAQFVIHPQAPEKPADQPEKAKRVAVIRAVTILMAVVVGLMVAFFWGHSFIWLLRDLHHKIRRRGQ